MRKLNLLIVVASLLAGCETTKLAKVDNPVMGPPPPRLPAAERAEKQPGELLATHLSDDQSPGDQAEIRQTSLSTTSTDSTADDQALMGTEIVASVNGAPILAGDILEQYAAQLESTRPKLTPAQFRELQLSLIRRDLDTLVERQLLVKSLTESLKPEQSTMINQQLDQFFEKEVDRMKKEMGVNSRLEVEQKLQAQGTSLQALKRNFVNQRLAMEYVAMKSDNPVSITRADLYNYYQKHIDDYATPTRVKWQQIAVSFALAGGKTKALETMETVIEKLRTGADFGALAQEFSNGPTANNQGIWDWTEPGSLANDDVNEVLASLPPGKISQVIDSGSSLQLVKILDRREAGFKPFEELQSEIQSILEKEQRGDTARDVVKELLQTAVVRTIFDQEKQ